MSKFTAKAGNIHYKVEGIGSPVLTVPGGPGSNHRLYPELTARHSVIYFDPLGTGESDRLVRAEDYTVGLYADTMLELLDHLGVRAAHILGRSFGGIPAAEFAARYPERVLSLVLCNAQVDAEGWQLGNIDNLNHHIANQYPDIWQQMLELRSKGILSNDEAYQNLLALPNQRMLWAGLDALPSTGASTFDETTYLAFTGQDPEWVVGGTLRGHTVLDRLVKHNIPTLILTGRRDIMASPAIAKRTADALNPEKTKLVIFERSAHFPLEEEPEEFFKILHAFLERYA
jgi:proline iminopeptidase